MGAVTAMFYTYSDARISAVCYDSAFSDFLKLAKELCKNHISLPNFVIDTAIKILRNTILGKNNLDIYKLLPINFSGLTTTPGFFIHAVNDELISIEHSINLFKAYKGKLFLII